MLTSRSRRPDSDERSAISVLVVDDEPQIVELVETVIGRCDYGLHVVGSAAGGYEGLRLWEQLRPDVVVLDLSMPDLHGSDVARRIRASDPDQAIVLFSALIDTTTVMDGSLRVPKTQMTELPVLIHGWISTRQARNGTS
jgi:CheY-like chemotaxis protein